MKTTENGVCLGCNKPVLRWVAGVRHRRIYGIGAECIQFCSAIGLIRASQLNVKSSPTALATSFPSAHSLGDRRIPSLADGRHLDVGVD